MSWRHNIIESRRLITFITYFFKESIYIKKNTHMHAHIHIYKKLIKKQVILVNPLKNKGV